MTINLDTPAEIEQNIQGMHSEEYDRKLKELTAIEAYRQRKIGLAIVQKILGFENRWKTIDFLSASGVYPNYNEEDAEDWAMKIYDEIRPERKLTHKLLNYST